MRKTKEELEKIKKKHKVNELWSWSKYHTYLTSPYEYFLKYVKHTPEDRTDGAYTAYGSACHDTLEDFYTGKTKYVELSSEFNNRLFTLDLADLKFARGDNDKNLNIKTKYIDNLKHFFIHHDEIKTKVDIERFLCIRVGDNIFQGYADLVRRDGDDFIIQDWKSSSIYKNEKITIESGQLLLYSEGLHQLGIPIENIKACWNFLKYCSVTVELANGKTNVRTIERFKLGESLASNAKMWLKKLGYIDEIENYIEMLNQTNSIEILPKDVQDKYKIEDCYVYINVNEDAIDVLKNNIVNTIEEIKEKAKSYEKDKDEKVFWDDKESVKEEDFYFATLCGYSKYLHKPYALYLEEKEKEYANKDNVFSNVGKDLGINDSMSWLNDI